MDGKPLVGGPVSFLPEVADGNRGRAASGMTDDNGRFRLTYDDPQTPRAGGRLFTEGCSRLRPTEKDSETCNFV